MAIRKLYGAGRCAATLHIGSPTGSQIISTCAAIVSSVFLLWFGESGAMLSDMAARIADGINAALLSTCRRRAESSTSTLQACGQRQERDFRRSVGRATMQASPP